MVRVKKSNAYQIGKYNVCSCGVLRRRRGSLFLNIKYMVKMK